MKVFVLKKCTPKYLDIRDMLIPTSLKWVRKKEIHGQNDKAMRPKQLANLRELIPGHFSYSCHLSGSLNLTSRERTKEKKLQPHLLSP
jgi:hypothetical protein